jgi:hypothetical protein
MSRFILALVAAAVAAVTAVAVVALPAIGDDGNGSTDPDVTAFAACLRAHGLPGAPNDPTTLKPWIAGQQADNPLAVKRAMLACDQHPSKPAADKPGPDAGAGPDADAVIACVRRHGIDAPTDPVAFKQWLAGQMSNASSSLRAALEDCKILPPDGAKQGGATKCVAPADKPPADKPPADKPQNGAPSDSAPSDEDGSV